MRSITSSEVGSTTPSAPISNAACLRASVGSDTKTLPAPAALAAATHISPIGPAPSTVTRSPTFIADLRTARTATARGSANAASWSLTSVGNGQRLPFRHQHVLGIASPALGGVPSLGKVEPRFLSQRKMHPRRRRPPAYHAVSLAPACHAGADGRDDAAVLVPHHGARLRHVVQERMHVSTADGAVLDLEHHLAGARLGRRYLLNLEPLLTLVDRCFHDRCPAPAAMAAGARYHERRKFAIR